MGGNEPAVSESWFSRISTYSLICFKDLQDADDADYQLMAKIAEYGIVECCGDDKFGRKTIVCSACRLPHGDVIKNSEFKTVQKFYDCLLK